MNMKIVNWGCIKHIACHKKTSLNDEKYVK